MTTVSHVRDSCTYVSHLLDYHRGAGALTEFLHPTNPPKSCSEAPV